MTPTEHFISKKLRLAGILIALGLIMEAVTLVWNHPLSFVAFLGGGVLLMLIGMAIYLWTIVSGTQSAPAAESDGNSGKQSDSSARA